LSSYDKFDDPYCYENSFVLKNLAGLRTDEALEAFEVPMVALRSGEVLPEGQFDPRHYRALHRHLFQDVYNWAGEYRTIRIAKNDTMFCYPECIAAQMAILFASLRGASFTPSSDPKDFVTAAASFLADLNAIHPFREGNGRTQLTFLFLLGHRAGHALDMSRIRPGEMLATMIASFKGKLTSLETEIARLLT
jgi:cell filamentation protein